MFPFVDSLYSLGFWCGYCPWDYAKLHDEDSFRKNRATNGIDLDTGHV